MIFTPSRYSSVSNEKCTQKVSFIFCVAGPYAERKNASWLCALFIRIGQRETANRSSEYKNASNSHVHAAAHRPNGSRCKAQTVKTSARARVVKMSVATGEVEGGGCRSKDDPNRNMMFNSSYCIRTSFNSLL